MSFFTTLFYRLILRFRFLHFPRFHFIFLYSSPFFYSFIQHLLFPLTKFHISQMILLSKEDSWGILGNKIGECRKMNFRGCIYLSVIYVWSVSVLGHSKAVRDICFNNTGTQFLSAAYDRYIKLWDSETGTWATDSNTFFM